MDQPVQSVGPAGGGSAKAGALVVGVGRGDWHAEFAAALDRQIAYGAPLGYEIFDIDAHDWLEQVQKYDLIFWKGRFMGPQLAGNYKEKIYFIEHVLGKVVVPNCATVWHFESKAAQSYLFAHFRVPTPRTAVSFEYEDARRMLDGTALPVVAKQPHGAASSNVRLLSDRSRARAWLRRVFFGEMWERHVSAHPTRLGRYALAPLHGWFWSMLFQNVVAEGHHRGVLYLQEFIAGNKADLRITVIGDRDAFGFWRRNRPGDFRASGSGLLDYETPVPEEAVRLCLGLNRQFSFDSMAYDILFRDGAPLVVEMSYGYVDKAVYGAPGHFVLDEQGDLVYRKGHVMPQAVWVDWALRKAGLEEPGDAT